MAAAAASHEDLTRGLRFVHLAIRRSLATVVTTAARPLAEEERAGFADFSGRVAKFIRSHHDGEEEIVFPALEKAGLAEVKVWKQEHEALLGALGRLDEAIAQVARGGAAEPLARAAVEVQGVLVPHLDAEEAVLDRAIRDLVSAEQAAALAQAASKHGQKHGGPRQLILFLHSLSDEEQRAHFGRMPWPVRRVLVRIWDRSFRAAVRYAHNRSIAI